MGCTRDGVIDGAIQGGGAGVLLIDERLRDHPVLMQARRRVITWKRASLLTEKVLRVHLCHG